MYVEAVVSELREEESVSHLLPGVRRRAAHLHSQI
jgi:hypothetical protein